MKNAMLYALWICFGLSTTINAQNNNSTSSTDDENRYRDTIMIIPSPESKVLLIGNGMKSLVKSPGIDSLKNLMINDVNNARKQASYPASAKVTHYFVSPNGKRRLKTESEDYTEPVVN